MAQSGSKKIANNLVAASCAAVLAVYVAGYARTQSAANKLASQVAERRLKADPPRPASWLKEPWPPAKVESPKAVGHSPGDARHDAVRRPSAILLPKAKPVSPIEPEPAPVPTPAAPARTPDPVVAEPPVQVAEQKIAPVASPPPVAPPVFIWKDGTYTGWGYSRHGNIEASVVIERGRIASATISQCRTRYSCSVIDKLPPEVAERQSPDVDYVSGATQSADAFYGAVVEALSKAK